MGQLRFFLIVLLVLLLVVYGMATSVSPMFLLVREISGSNLVNWSLLLDLYTGVLIFSVWMMAQEASIWRSTAWLTFFVISGNIGVLIYLIIKTADCSSKQLDWLFLDSKGA